MASFGARTSEGKFKDLLIQYEEFNRDNTCEYKANDLSLNAWHILEWVYNEFPEVHLTPDIGKFRATLYPHCNSLKIMHDIANDLKHSKLNSPKAFIRESKKHLGPFSSAFSREFDQTILEIEMQDGKVLYFIDEIEKVMNFWKIYFENELGITISGQ